MGLLGLNGGLGLSPELLSSLGITGNEHKSNIGNQLLIK